MVSQKTIKALDFDKILHAIGELCIADDSAALLASRCPIVNTAGVLREHKLLRAIARKAQGSGALPQVAHIPSCTYVLDAPKVKIYTLEELALLRNALQGMQTCAQWVDAMVYCESTAPLAFCSALIPRALLETLSRFFDNLGAVRTENIPQLRDIERKRLRVHRARGKIAEEFLHTHSAICASHTATLRDDRIVLAIQASHKSDVAGVVHGSSAREKSAYVEIPQLYELNNEALQLREEERAAYYKLCVTLSEQVAKVCGKFRACYEAFMEFDGLYARYRYGCMTGGALVAQVPEGLKAPQSAEQAGSECHIYLERVVNPFVEQCSPLTFDMRGGVRQLVLTGPNAGGKTVALKTLGLCALMNQSAIPLPLRTQDSSRCVLPVFETIDVVIGDAQDLQLGVSTFSSHMARVRDSLNATNGGKTALLLFDEFCADTDDREGGALACALLEYLAGTNSTVCVTTHSASVKHYVITAPHSKACLAALRISENKLAGKVHAEERNAQEHKSKARAAYSYAIAYNAIGTSEAVQVARGVGLPESVLKGYEKFLDLFGKDYQGMLSALQDSYAQVETVRAHLSAQHREGKKRIETLQAEKRALVRERRERAQRDLAEGSPLITQMRKTLERLSEVLAKAKNAGAGDVSARNFSDIKHGLSADRAIVRTFEEGLTELQQEVDQCAPADVHEKEELKEGDPVLIVENGAQGTVLSVSQDKRKYHVQAGVLTLTLARDKLQRIVLVAEEKDAFAHVSYVDSATLSLESCLDLRGCTAEEAREKLEAYIDAALLKNRKVLSVIHGKGTGVLMRELHGMLRQHALVERAEHAQESDGGAGKTYVYLK